MLTRALASLLAPLLLLAASPSGAGGESALRSPSTAPLPFDLLLQGAIGALDNRCPHQGG